MAIVQISRITQRKGLTEDLPQPLAGAELGWAIDQRRLFIGNGELADGAPVVGNTEILTEFSDVLAFTTGYTYKGEAGGYTVQTGPTVSSPISQSIQSRLDSIAIITDFGATGDGVTDDTAAINRALYQLYCRQTNTQTRRGLYFPAGTYLITDTIKIPSYAFIYGDGPESTIIKFSVNAWTSTIAYTVGILVSYSGSYYRSVAEVPIGTNISDLNFWSPEPLPAYIAQTADSLQQTGINSTTNGATAPLDINVVNMGFATTQMHDGILVENATKSVTFDRVAIFGPLISTQINTAVDDISAVRYASTASLVCTQVAFYDCVFQGWTYGQATDQEINGCAITNCYFNTLYRGIYLGGVTPENGGASGVKILHNTFDQIYHEGIVFDNVELNMSGFNIFYNVGNELQTAPLSSGSSTAVISINADQNISVGDMFERTTAQANSTNPRIQLNNTASIGYDSASQVQLGTYVRETGTKATLTNNSSGTLYDFPASDIPALKMDYTIKRNTLVRTGTITIVADAEDSAGDFSYTDDFTENNRTGVLLSASDTSISGGNIVISWSTDDTGNNATIYYSITHLYRA